MSLGEVQCIYFLFYSCDENAQMFICDILKCNVTVGHKYRFWIQNVCGLYLDICMGKTQNTLITNDQRKNTTKAETLQVTNKYLQSEW